MLHDLLFALNGIEGDLFRFKHVNLSIEGKKQTPNSVYVDFVEFQVEMVELPWLHPGEVACCLDLLTQFGCPFKMIKKWTEQVLDAKKICDPNGGSSMYMEALAYGLRDVVVVPYLDSLCSIEEHLVSTYTENKEAILVKGNPFAELRMRLQKYLAFMKRVPDFLRSVSTIPAGSSAFTWTTLKLNELSCLEREEASGSPPLFSQLSYRVNLVFARQCLAWLSGRDVFDPVDEFFVTKTKNGDEYDISNQNIPYFVNSQLATEISNAGQMLRLIPQEIVDAEYKPFLSTFKDQLELLFKTRFHPMEVERIINHATGLICDMFRKFLVNKMQLQTIVDQLREGFFLGNGEVFEEFLRLKIDLEASGSAINIYEMNRLLHSASDKFSDNNLSITKKFKFTVEALSEPENQDFMANFSNLFCGQKYFLNYTAEASEQKPLKWAISKRDFIIYFELFMVLITLKQTQLILRDTWHIKFPDAEIQKKVWSIRYRLHTVLDSWWAFLQFDVIQENHNKWAKKLEDRVDAADFLSGHQSWHYRKYLNPILQQSLLNVSAINQCLANIIKLTVLFCGKLNAVQENMEWLDDVEKELDGLSSFLVRSCNAIVTSRTLGENSSVEKLLLKLNFNESY